MTTKKERISEFSLHPCEYHADKNQAAAAAAATAAAYRYYYYEHFNSLRQNAGK